MARETDIAKFLASRGVGRHALAAAAGVTIQELNGLIARPDTGEAATRVQRCFDAWDRRHSACCEGWALLHESGDEIWRLFLTRMND